MSITTKQEDKLRAFLGDKEGVVYTIVNLTRKTVGVCLLFEEGHAAGMERGRFLPRCPYVSREHKLTGEHAVVPDQMDDLCISGNIAKFKQYRYVGAKKRDDFVVFKAYINIVGIL